MTATAATLATYDVRVTSPRPPAAQITLRVLETEWLSRGMVRVSAGGEQLKQFTDRPETDKYVKLYFPPIGSTLKPPYDLTLLRQQVRFEELPAVRTYTVRRVDHARGSIDIDFVVHGDTGVAGPWAANAKPGDALTFAGPGGGFRPSPDVDHHVLIGDESALPAIAASLESMPAHSRPVVVIEARSEAHRIPLPSAATVHWVDEDHDAPGARLVDAVSALAWPEGRVQVFAHGERGAMKQLRGILAERGVERADLSLSAYWALGRTEDVFQAEKREPVGHVLLPS